jgi:hypothetical protein
MGGKGGSDVRRRVKRLSVEMNKDLRQPGATGVQLGIEVIVVGRRFRRRTSHCSQFADTIVPSCERARFPASFRPASSVREFSALVEVNVKAMKLIANTYIFGLEGHGGPAREAIVGNEVPTLPRIRTAHAQVVRVTRGNFKPFQNLHKLLTIESNIGLHCAQVRCRVHVSVVKLRAAGSEARKIN